jgi:hypothetical protein
VTRIDGPKTSFTPKLPEIPENEPSGKLGTIDSVNGAPTQDPPAVSSKSTSTGDEAGTLKMTADVKRQQLERELDLTPKKGPDQPRVKWEGPDFDAIKK